MVANIWKMDSKSCNFFPWWRHQMEIFSALLAICAGNSPVTGEFPAKMPVMRSFDDFFDLRLNIRLSKQSWDWWFETPSLPLWRHCNAWWLTCTIGTRSAEEAWIRTIYFMMTSSNGNNFRVIGNLCGEFTGDRWIPRTKASDAELWCFLWSSPEYTAE